MSNVSNLHNVTVYTGKERAFSSQRLATITYRTNKETGEKPESKCISVPMFDTTEVLNNFERCSSILQDYFQGVQDKIIRELIEQDKSKTSIHSEEIGFNACLAYLQESQSGTRLSKDYLAEWFADDVEAILADTLATKLGADLGQLTPQQEKVIKTTLSRFSGWITSLASPKVHFGDDVIAQLEKCFGLVSASPLLDKLQLKLKEMRKQNSLLSDGLAL